MGDSYAQFIIVLIIFVGVLAVTLFVTRWMAGYQKTRLSGSNIRLIESTAIGTGKYIQIVCIGDKYVALAVSKDNITMLCELDENSLSLNDNGTENRSFASILNRVKTVDKRE